MPKLPYCVHFRQCSAASPSQKRTHANGKSTTNKTGRHRRIPLPPSPSPPFPERKAKADGQTTNQVKHCAQQQYPGTSPVPHRLAAPTHHALSHRCGSRLCRYAGRPHQPTARRRPRLPACLSSEPSTAMQVARVGGMMGCAEGGGGALDRKPRRRHHQLPLSFGSYRAGGGEVLIVDTVWSKKTRAHSKSLGGDCRFFVIAVSGSSSTKAKSAFGV